MAKILRLAVNTLLTVILATLLAVYALPRVFGYKPYMVVSASMQQSFPVGSLIFVRDAQPDEIEVGDPITFRTETLIITHRVVAIDRGSQEFTTKGDNNNTTETIPFDHLLGKALNFSIPYLGYVSAWFITLQGKITVISVIAAMALLSLTLGKLEELDNDEAKEGES